MNIGQALIVGTAIGGIITFWILVREAIICIKEAEAELEAGFRAYNSCGDKDTLS